MEQWTGELVGKMARPLGVPYAGRCIFSITANRRAGSSRPTSCFTRSEIEKIEKIEKNAENAGLPV